MKRVQKRKTTRPVKRRVSRKMPAAPTVSVDFNRDIDWTPEHAKLYPRRVLVRQGRLLVGIEEARYATGELALMVGLGTKGGDVTYNVMAEEMSPSEFDGLIQLLVIARDKARELGLPDDRQNGPSAAQALAILETVKLAKAQGILPAA